MSQMAPLSAASAAPASPPAATSAPASAPFVDRRSSESPGVPTTRERRQFTNSHEELSPDARELAIAIDQYKLHHRRRFITYEEMLTIITRLGYSKR